MIAAEHYSTLLARVESAVETVKPYLKADGGDIRIIGITDDKIVEVEMLGACETCPMSAMTMKAGVEQAIRSKVPEIEGVVAIQLNSSPKVD